MTDPTDRKPNVTEPAAKAAAEREERLAAALRANLQRRKQQNRARAADPPTRGTDGEGEGQGRDEGDGGAA